MDIPELKASGEDLADMDMVDPKSSSMLPLGKTTSECQKNLFLELPFSPRLAAVWNPNWQPDDDSNTTVQTGSQEEDPGLELGNKSDNPEISEPTTSQSPTRSILKNAQEVIPPKKKGSKDRAHKYSNSKSKEDNNGDGDNDSRSNTFLTKSEPDIEKYRRYLIRTPPKGKGAEDGSKTDDAIKTEEEEREQMLATRQTMALTQAIMSLALLAISGSQLRFVIAYEIAQPFATLNYFLLTICIITEIVAGIGYLILARFQFNENLMDKLQSGFMIALFWVGISTIIVSCFSLESHVCDGFMDGSNGTALA